MKLCQAGKLWTKRLIVWLYEYIDMPNNDSRVAQIPFLRKGLYIGNVTTTQLPFTDENYGFWGHCDYFDI